MKPGSKTYNACRTPPTEGFIEGGQTDAGSHAGKVCVLVGASNPVGFCLAQSFLETGYRVAVGDLDPSDFSSLTAVSGTNLFPVKVNLNRDVYVNSMVDQVYLRWSRVDILVNIAFRRRECAEPLSATDLGLDAVSNLIRVTSAFGSRLQGEELAVVNIAWFDEKSLLEADREAVLQAALRTTTSAMAKKYFDSGLRINAVHTRNARSTSYVQSETLRTLVQAVQFLANPELSGKLTGNVLHIDLKPDDSPFRR